MIKRRKLVTQQDSIRQGSLTAQKGIDLSKAPVQSDTMADIVNFDVDDDGGLILRKPLLLAHDDSSDGAIFVFYAYNGSRIVVLSERRYMPGIKESTPISIDDYTGFGYTSELAKYPERKMPGAYVGTNTYNPNEQIPNRYYVEGLIIYPKFFNTSSSTILYTNKGLCKLIYQNHVWYIVRHVPEPNRIEPDNDIPYNPNLLLADPNVVNPNESGAVFRVLALTAYAPVTVLKNTALIWLSNQHATKDNPPKTWLTRQDISDIEVAGTTYSVRYLPVDYPVRNDGVLALTLFTEGIGPQQTCYVVWEVSVDGTTYHALTPTARGTTSVSDTANRYGFYTSNTGGHIITCVLKRPKQILSDYDNSELSASDILNKGLDIEYEDVTGYLLNQPFADTRTLYVDLSTTYTEGVFTVTSYAHECTIRASVYTAKHKNNTDGTDGWYTGTLLGTRTWYYGETRPAASRTEKDAGHVVVSEGYTYVEPVNFNTSEVLYHNQTVYNFGSSLKNVIYPSETGSFITPLYNQINLTANEDSVVNALVPWRNNLIAMTDTAVYRIVKTDAGYASATVTTFTGVPKQDRRTVKAILNGIIFKSHEKIYTLYPNTYSEDENILRLSEISTPVAKYVSDDESDISFAIVTPSEYLLFTRYYNKPKTQCLRYSYSTRVWSRYLFNVALVDYVMLSTTDIRLFGEWYRTEYRFDKLLEEVVKETVNNPALTSPELYVNITYGDWLTTVVNANTVQEVLHGTLEPVTPFEFTVDSGQKSDAMGIVKQFVETKATYTAQSDNADFPTELSLYIDGDEHPLQLEEATDAAVQRGNQNSLVLGTEVHTASASLKDTTVRYFAKHSGKGKSIRYVLKGKSVSRFKLYEIAYRYRLPRSKQ